MKSVLMVIAPSMFRDEEYAIPHRVLVDHGYRVVTASSRAGECLGKLGMVVDATLSIEKSLQSEWDCVVFVGGGGAQVFFDDPLAHELARRARGEHTVLAAICIAPSILARAGLLTGVRATAYPSQKDDLITHGAQWTGEEVTVDGRVVTANGPEAAFVFAERVVALLEQVSAIESEDRS